MTDVEHVPATAPELEKLTLDELAERAREQSLEVGRRLSSAIAVAIELGETLHELRRRVQNEDGSEGWILFVRSELGMTEDSASRLIRLAYYRDRLPDEAFEPYVDEAGHRQFPGYSRALEYLKGLPHVPDDRPGHNRTPPERIAEIRRLYAEGVPVQEIARLLNASKRTVRRYVDENFDRRNRAEEKRRQAERRDALRALQRERERDRAGAPLDAVRPLHRAEEQIVALLEKERSS